ncbi:MAG: DUF4340 domain-containing protein [Gammaproteobacteria bacterium]|nr:DUF4340 domain-containing protein [Gammaproteobacteria bacterium]
MFTSRLLLNLGLLMLLIILIATALISQQPSVSESAFSALKINDVTQIEIDYNQQITALTKTQEQWHITQPLSVQADTFRLQALLNILTIKEPLQYQIAEADYKKYSLQPPLATVRLNQQAFYFGSTSPVNGKRYVLTRQKLFLIDDTFFPLFTSGYKNLMRRQLFPDNTTLQSIKIGKQLVSQNAQGSWQAADKAISPDHLKQFVDNWLHIQAFAVSKASKPYKGSEVILKTGDNKTLRRFIHKRQANTLVINPELGLSYQLDIKAYESLSNPAYYSKTFVAD